ncbi:vacuolar protein-sorting-associated protein 25 [Pristis pectinata]|uniref:vacuolar protein-sorting-associated protein 25 n=1 Tax=Pristis pectinata TaxID=685728 RepID=UPI00223E01EE|nr:vacuolar protein-sorting-associated protein 25 [Pristis pectinata]
MSKEGYEEISHQLIEVQSRTLYCNMNQLVENLLPTLALYNIAMPPNSQPLSDKTTTNVNTQPQAAGQHGAQLVLSYLRYHKLYTIDVLEAQESPLFNNKKIQRKFPIEAIQVVLEELRKKGNLEWIDKNKTRCLIMWRRPEEWGKLVYQWVSKNGLTNSVFTFYELSNGDDTEGEEFHGLEEWLLLRALQALQTERKAEIITLADSKGVKFF